MEVQQPRSQRRNIHPEWCANQGVKEEIFIQSGAPRQRNIAQMKEQIKTPEKELSNEEIVKLSDAEFKTLVICEK